MRLNALLTATLIFGLTAMTARGDWFESFDGAYDNAGWTNFPDNGSANWNVDLSNNYWHGTATGGIPAAFPTSGLIPGSAGPGAVIGVVPEVFTNVEVSGHVNLNPESTAGLAGSVTGNNGHGLLLRGNLISGQGYLLNASLGWGALQIVKIDGANLPTLNETGNGLFNSSSTMFLVFQAIGTSLEGWAYTDSTRTTQLAHIATTDASYGSGYSGIIASFVSSRSDATIINGTFDDVASIAIPEPATMLLAGIGVVAFGRIRQRR